MCKINSKIYTQDLHGTSYIAKTGRDRQQRNKKKQRADDREIKKGRKGKKREKQMPRHRKTYPDTYTKSEHCGAEEEIHRYTIVVYTYTHACICTTK